MFYHKTGEFLIDGPTVMKGYWKDEEATRENFIYETTAEGGERRWLCTGDVGYFDDNDVVHVIDRMKEMIKYKGNQVKERRNE